MRVSRRSQPSRACTSSLLESLESRLHLAATASVVDLDGDTVFETLRVIGDNKAQAVSIVEDFNTGEIIVSVDLNGDGLFTGAGEINGQNAPSISNYDLDLGGGNDSFLYQLAGVDDGGESGPERTFELNMGSGNDTAFFNSAAGGSSDSRISANVMDIHFVGGAGNDSFDFRFKELGTIALVRIDADLGAGNDQFGWIVDKNTGSGQFNIVDVSVLGGAGNDLVLIHPLNVSMQFESIGDARVTFDINLGAGNDEFDYLGTQSEGSGFVDVDTTVRVDGGDGNDLIKIDTVLVGNESDSDSFDTTVAFVVRAGKGNDTVTVTLPTGAWVQSSYQEINVDEFRILSTRALIIDVSGNEGNDTLNVFRRRNGIPPAFPATIEGIVDIKVRGGDGKDTITATLDTVDIVQASYQLDNQFFDNSGSRFALTLDGQAGNDTMLFDATNVLFQGAFLAFGSNRALDLRVLGGAGNDTITARLTTPSIATFAALYAGTNPIRLDGGLGKDVLLSADSLLPTGTLAIRFEVV